jgi:phage baseplate assembly protein W
MALENPRTSSTRARDKDPDSKIGVVLPIRLGANGYFKQSSTLLEQTKSNLKNLLLTVKGERVGQPEFGSDLFNILFEPFDDELSSKIDSSIRDAISAWLPHVLLKGIQIDADQNSNFLEVSLTFSIETDPNAMESLTLNLQQPGI